MAYFLLGQRQDSIAGYVGYGGLIYVVDGSGSQLASESLDSMNWSPELLRSSPGKLPDNGLD